MKAYCTYCSCKKQKNGWLLPAIERYNSRRIKSIHGKAESDGVELFILSGRFGFIHCETRIPLYNQLLTSEEVPGIVDKLKWQIENYGISEIVYYAKVKVDDGKLKPYGCAIKQACHDIRVTFSNQIWTE